MFLCVSSIFNLSVWLGSIIFLVKWQEHLTANPAKLYNLFTDPINQSKLYSLDLSQKQSENIDKGSKLSSYKYLNIRHQGKTISWIDSP